MADYQDSQCTYLLPMRSFLIENPDSEYLGMITTPKTGSLEKSFTYLENGPFPENNATVLDTTGDLSERLNKASKELKRIRVSQGKSFRGIPKVELLKIFEGKHVASYHAFAVKEE